MANARPSTKRPEVMRERVLGAFGRWLAENPVDGHDHGDVLDVVHTACELKASVLDEPNPADWSPSSMRDVIGEVFPAKTVGVDGHYARTIVPAMLGYVDFLVATGRWKPAEQRAALPVRAAESGRGPPRSFR